MAFDLSDGEDSREEWDARIGKSETYDFQADMNQILSLIIDTFYSKKEIFLPELISNSSDALDEIRYERLTNKSALDAQPELFIQLLLDEVNKTISIIDSGIGTTKTARERGPTFDFRPGLRPEVPNSISAVPVDASHHGRLPNNSE